MSAQSKHEEELHFNRSNWIPIFGYYLTLLQSDPTRRHLRFPIIYSILLIGFVVSPLFIRFDRMLPWGFTLPYIFIVIGILSVALVIIAEIETRWVRNSEDPNSDAFKKRGWDQLAGKSHRYVFAAFVYFNYQELALAAFGLIYGVLIHTIF